MSRAVDLWAEVLGNTLEDVGVSLPDGVLQKLAEAAATHEECSRDFSYRPPDPSKAEIARLEARLKAERDAAEKAEDVWREITAHLGGVRPEQLYRDRDRIKVLP